MTLTCNHCGTENTDAEKSCHTCGAALGAQPQLGQAGLQTGSAEERVLWENGDIQLTTEAVLIGLTSDSPTVVPLDTVHEAILEDRCLVLKVKDGDDKYCMLDDPSELAALVQDHMDRSRLAHGRTDSGFIPPD